MRKFIATGLVVLGLVLLGTGTAAASGPVQHGSFVVWATPDAQNNVVIDGSFNVPYGTHGPITLYLFGRSDAGVWHDVKLTTTVNVVLGQTNYKFDFNTKGDRDHFRWYKVYDDDGDSSRSVDRDECGFRVAEAPSSGLLLLGALPIGLLAGLRVTGTRLPRPRWTRVA